jgi:hypothetical protein
MMKFSQTPRQSILALVAVAALGSVGATDASARGFGGGGFGGGGHSFGGMGGRSIGGGGQFSGNSLRQVSLGSPAGGIHVPSGAGLRATAPGRVIQPPPGGFHVPSGAGLQPIHPGATIQAATKPVPVRPGGTAPTAPPDHGGGTDTQRPPVAVTPATPETPAIISPADPRGTHLRLPPPGSVPSLLGPRLPITDPHGGGALQPPHVGVVQPTVPRLPPGQTTVPRLPPVQSPHPIDPPPYAGNPNPPAYPPAAGGGYDGPTISVGLAGAVVGDAVAVAVSDTAAVAVPAVSYTPVSGLTCDRLLRNGCYLAMRKYSTPNGGAELRCTMICE